MTSAQIRSLCAWCAMSSSAASSLPAPSSHNSRDYAVIPSPWEESYLFCNRWKCEYCHRIIWRQSRFLLRNDERGKQLAANHVCHEKECDRLQKARRSNNAVIVEGGESDNRKCIPLNWSGLSGLVLVAALLYIILSLSLNKNGGPPLAPAPLETSPTLSPSAAESSPSLTRSRSCTIESIAVETARRNLDDELLGDAGACTDRCEYNVTSFPEYSTMMDACEEARGAFHLFSVVVTCNTSTVLLDSYPDCLVSQSQNSECTPDYSESYLEHLRAQDNCTALSFHSGTSDFSSSNSTFPRRLTNVRCCLQTEWLRRLVIWNRNWLPTLRTVSSRRALSTLTARRPTPA
jgi:hypothetical protein